MSEYIPKLNSCNTCTNTNKNFPVTANKIEPTPCRTILSLVMILNHDQRDGNKQGFWEIYNDDIFETCTLCHEKLFGHRTIETSCLHRFHYNCIMHHVIIHNMKHCPDNECKFRIF